MFRDGLLGFQRRAIAVDSGEPHGRNGDGALARVADAPRYLQHFGALVLPGLGGDVGQGQVLVLVRHKHAGDAAVARALQGFRIHIGLQLARILIAVQTHLVLQISDPKVGLNRPGAGRLIGLDRSLPGQFGGGGIASAGPRVQRDLRRGLGRLGGGLQGKLDRAFGVVERLQGEVAIGFGLRGAVLV